MRRTRHNSNLPQWSGASEVYSRAYAVLEAVGRDGQIKGLMLHFRDRGYHPERLMSNSTDTRRNARSPARPKSVASEMRALGFEPRGRKTWWYEIDIPRRYGNAVRHVVVVDTPQAGGTAYWSLAYDPEADVTDDDVLDSGEALNTVAAARAGIRAVRAEWPDGGLAIDTWFERDRAHVALRDMLTDTTVVEWWDDEVNDAVEGGFLDPRDWHGSAVEYAEERGLL